MNIIATSSIGHYSVSDIEPSDGGGGGGVLCTHFNPQLAYTSFAIPIEVPINRCPVDLIGLHYVWFIVVPMPLMCPPLCRPFVPS